MTCCVLLNRLFSRKVLLSLYEKSPRLERDHSDHALVRVTEMTALLLKCSCPCMRKKSCLGNRQCSCFCMIKILCLKNEHCCAAQVAFVFVDFKASISGACDSLKACRIIPVLKLSNSFRSVIFWRFGGLLHYALNSPTRKAFLLEVIQNPEGLPYGA